MEFEVQLLRTWLGLGYMLDLSTTLNTQPLKRLNHKYSTAVFKTENWTRTSQNGFGW